MKADVTGRNVLAIFDLCVDSDESSQHPWHRTPQVGLPSFAENFQVSVITACQPHVPENQKVLV